MNMKNLLQIFNNIEPNDSSNKKTLIQEGTRPGQILNIQMEELETESLRYLSGLRKTIEECGLAPMTPMYPNVPKPPASINMSAADAGELGSMLKVLANLANGTPHSNHEVVQSVNPGPATQDSNHSFADMIKRIDNVELVQDGMNDDDPVYDNSPDRETHGGNWPLDGDMDNNQAANKDVLVDRNKMDIAEQLMADYRAFISEEEKDQDKVSEISEKEEHHKNKIAITKKYLKDHPDLPQSLKNVYTASIRWHESEISKLSEKGLKEDTSVMKWPKDLQGIKDLLKTKVPALSPQEVDEHAKRLMKILYGTVKKK